MSEITPINYIEKKPNSPSNKHRIIGKGVTVEFLAHFINDPEWTVDEICENYGLTPAEVDAAWAFYCDHKAEIEQNQRDYETHLKELEREYPEVAAQIVNSPEELRESIVQNTATLEETSIF